MTKDNIYADKEKSIAGFNFGSDTAEVFDDMLNRSVPHRTAENEQLLQRHGFRYTDIFYKWYSFCGLVAVRQ